ncbi:hypothetical protein HYH02_012356 [Chlamydomonas schloesseri]|uniref:Bifunctional lysine-specific demethylase and histidyl-hydroxylase n=1 Tax=Chlamydomonas schloesseri TaxID=2026947 RepID=A0A835W380_9CHLO|nr:hypothetical protein HYH02_012356 [Chlamydomonas schloesseri]|eukprot:KAG2434336.1 hypothetical protein HYH02_012356 [Chlamydomonas schloesseri]
MAKRKHSEPKEEPKVEEPVEEPEEDEDEEDEDEDDGFAFPGAGEPEPYDPQPVDLNPLQFLVAPTDLSEFLKSKWEKAPLHIPADEARKEFFAGLFDFKALCRIADQMEAGAMILMDQDPGEKGDALGLDDDVNDEMIREIGPLVFGRDVVAVRYIDGKRDEIRASFATSESLTALHDDAHATLQLHQPQRFVNACWRLLAALEAQLGCLVGCNAYVTPPGGQGLAPHHDDVELFVCQTQGTKAWKLYAPAKGSELPYNSSGDLQQEELGKPLLEVTLQPGDVLYVPRGVVHQAAAQEQGSCHLTISTYQHWTVANLAGEVLKQSMAPDVLSHVPLDLRAGLPLGTIYKHGLTADMQSRSQTELVAGAKPDAAAVAAALRKLAAAVEAAPVELVSPAVEAMAADFLMHRLPPHPAQLQDGGEEPSSLDDLIYVRGTDPRRAPLFRLVPCEEDGDDEEEGEGEDEDEDEEEMEEHKGPFVRLVTPLSNSRFRHMITKPLPDEEEGLPSDSEDEEGGHVHGPGCGHGHGHGHDSDDEGEEEDEDEEGEGKEKEKEKAGKKGGKKEAAAKKEKKEEEEEEEGKKAEDEEDEGDEGMEVDDVDSEELAGAIGGDDFDDDDDEEEDDEEEPEELPGPVFPAAYAPVLGAVLGSSEAQPLAVRSLQVPGDDDQERLRLAVLLHDMGIVVCVKKGEGDKEEEKEEEEKKEEKGKKGKKEEAPKKEEPAKPKSAEKKGKEAAPAKKEEAPKSGGKEAPAAKKAKKGGK